MKLKLINKIKLFEDVISFIFEPQENLTWIPGQYLHYVLHHEGTDDRGSDRWFTVSSAPFEGHVAITTRHAKDRVSSFKEKLFALPIGKNIEISYLEGDFTVKDSSKELVFIAGGIGITPFRSILKQLDHDKKPINVALLYANRDQNIVFKDELEEIAIKNPNFKINYIFSPEHIDENKIKEITDYKNKIYYVSGPEPMVEDLIKMLKEMEISEENIKGDWFPNYKDY